MAVEVIEDLIAGASSSSDITKGEGAIRVFIVTGVVGDGYEILINAKKAPGVPQIGEPHPANVNILVLGVSADGISTDIITLTIRYAAPDFDQPVKDQVIITGGSSLTSAETNLDVNGNVITTAYTYPEPYPEAPHLAGKTFTHGAMVQKLVPTSRASLTRLEDQNPLIFSPIYTGRINSQPFLFFPAGFWMCTDISGESQDGGATFNTTYSFEFKYDSWQQQVVFITESGDPPAFANPDEIALGVRNYDIYPTADFNQLGL